MRSAKQIRAEHKRVCTKMEELMREGDGVTQEVLDKVCNIVREHGATEILVLGSFKRYGMPDRKLVDAALEGLQRQGRIIGWPLNALPPEMGTT